MKSVLAYFFKALNMNFKRILIREQAPKLAHNVVDWDKSDEQ